MSEHKMLTRGKKAASRVPTTKSESKRKHRKLSSDDSDSESDSELESGESEDESPLEMSNLEYQQLLLTLYPSKFQENKVDKISKSDNKKTPHAKNKCEPEKRKSSKKDDCVAIIMVHNDKNRRKSKNDMFNEDIDSEDEDSDEDDEDDDYGSEDDSDTEVSSEESSNDDEGDKDSIVDMSTYESDKADIIALRKSFDLLPDSQKQTKIAKKMFSELINNE